MVSVTDSNSVESVYRGSFSAEIKRLLTVFKRIFFMFLTPEYISTERRRFRMVTLGDNTNSGGWG